LATEQELSLETMRNVGTAAVRNAMLMNASSVSFAAALQDQNVKKLDVGDCRWRGGRRRYSGL